eukprot:540628-Prymnesium_polylepis.1
MRHARPDADRNTRRAGECAATRRALRAAAMRPRVMPHGLAVVVTAAVGATARRNAEARTTASPAHSLHG